MIKVIYNLLKQYLFYSTLLIFVSELVLETNLRQAAWIICSTTFLFAITYFLVGFPFGLSWKSVQSLFLGFVFVNNLLVCYDNLPKNDDEISIYFLNDKFYRKYNLKIDENDISFNIISYLFLPNIMLFKIIPYCASLLAVKLGVYFTLNILPRLLIIKKFMMTIYFEFEIFVNKIIIVVSLYSNKIINLIRNQYT